MKDLAGICSPSLAAGQQQRNPVPQLPWCAWPPLGSCHQPGGTGWQRALQGPSASRTHLGAPGCSAKLRPAPARSPHEFCFTHITAGCFSQSSQRGGSYPNLLRSSHVPSSPWASQGSCSRLCHRWCAGTSQNRQNCPNCKVHPHLTPGPTAASNTPHHEPTTPAHTSTPQQGGNPKNPSHQRGWKTGQSPGQTPQ